MLPKEPLVYITLIALLPICNPLSTVPLFLSLTRKHTNAERNRQALLASVYMFAILFAFAVGGSYIIAFFGISVPAIRIAGGAIVGYIGFRMLFPVESEQSGEKNTPPPKKDVAFSPLAMPSLAGPGSISVVLAIASDTTDPLSYLFIGIGILIMAAIAFAVLRMGGLAADEIRDGGDQYHDLNNGLSTDLRCGAVHPLRGKYLGEGNPAAVDKRTTEPLSQAAPRGVNPAF